ncbi:MAG: DNA repair protein [Clostridia bacterium]|nr:DNA repair protein [Clostridia bacterium]
MKKDKSLKKLSRSELLELLLETTKEYEIQSLELKRLKAELDDRKIKIENLGSIAEAALVLNGVMESAEKAASQYIINAELIMNDAVLKSKAIIADAEAEAERIIQTARSRKE